jgi:adenine phosphoribosyltransferase
MSSFSVAELQSFIRDVPDFPKPGILFKDITPMLGNAGAFAGCLELLATALAPYRPAYLAGIESRGFIFASALANKLGVGFVPMRKPGKLPWRTKRQSYALEYGTDAIEIHEDAVPAGARVAVVDDLLATGGTANAAIQLLRGCGAEVVAAAFVIELGFLQGRQRLELPQVVSLISY